MAVIMDTEIVGADATFIDGMRAAGVVDAISKAPGFVSHISGATSSGYRVIEVWDHAKPTRHGSTNTSLRTSLPA
jgi:hypothetical protein